MSSGPPGGGRWRSLLAPAVLLVVFWAVAVGLWLATGIRFCLFNFGFIGTALGLGAGAYMLLPRAAKPRGRRFTLLLVGSYMLGFLGFHLHENMQLEGTFHAAAILGLEWIAYRFPRRPR